MVAAPLQLTLESIKFDQNGLVPAVIQAQDSNRVLMLGYMNQESLKQTLGTGLVTFWSRSRKAIWVKGDTSGNRLTVVSISVDCDADALLIRVIPTGPTCHTGNESCFSGNDDE